MSMFKGLTVKDGRDLSSFRGKLVRIVCFHVARDRVFSLGIRLRDSILY